MQFLKFFICLLYLTIAAEQAAAYTANKVWFEFLENGRYRVYVNYTIPALKEFRESYLDFVERKKAEEFYWALVRGAEFHPSRPESSQFTPPKMEPTPW